MDELRQRMAKYMQMEELVKLWYLALAEQASERKDAKQEE